MSIAKHLLRSISVRFNAWLTKVGEENRPYPHRFDHQSEEVPLLTDRDRMGDEKG